MEGTYLRADEPFRFESHHQIRPQIVLDSWSKSRGSVGVKYLRSPLNIGQPIILKFVAAPKNTTTTIPSIIKLVDQGLGIGFTYPKLITIFGTPTAPTRFDISLANDGVLEETADIPFHISADFSQKKVITDSWAKGTGWIGKESKEVLPFKVGQSFELTFRTAGTNEIDIIVDRSLFLTLNRTDLSKITQLEIKGAIVVKYLIMCKKRF
uniref:Galectin n=1 Tax=Meloidogyne enterolobii TaxID=390850 RepID=A0A6V7XZI2_MELEN|nr:unnamed protein product [Meloidogyne enterolobii]